MAFTNQTKNTTTITNENPSSESETFAAEGTFAEEGTFGTHKTYYANQTKNTTTITNQTKN